jgi:uncharacterized Zn finger protein
MTYRCSCCGSRQVLPELVWEAGDEGTGYPWLPYIEKTECLQCGQIDKLPRKKKAEKRQGG